ncbi:MAG TPA: Yip1 family protein, partial [Allosphingosinicella sp.]|nr:Yip1 family protein [Allosphingosinicella sp.]
METPQPTPVEMPQAEPGMVGRIKRILLEPKSEWARIDAEPDTVAGIFTRWVLILAAIPAVAGLIGALVFGYGAFGFVYRPSVTEAVGGAVVRYVFTIVGTFVLALIIDALAPQFGGTKNRVQAVKVAAYAATASWLAGIFGIVPSLAILGLLGLYSLYLLYLGLPRLMKAPEEKAMPYTLVTLAAAIVL